MSRGNSPARMWPTTAGRPASAAATFTTSRSEVAPLAPNRLESATTRSELPLTAASPTGASPTRTAATRARFGSLTSRAAAKHSRSSLARAVTHSCVPSAAVVTRTGWQPASTVATTDAAGSVSARRRSITVSVPSDSAPPGPAMGLAAPVPRAAISLVAYSQRPPGDTVMPTGASSRGMLPT